MKCQLVVSKLLVVIFIFECFGELLSLLTVATLGGTNIYFWVALLLSDNTFYWLPPPLLFNYETCGNHFQELQYFEVLFCCAYFVPSLPGVLCVLSCEANLHIVCETEHRFNLNHWLKHGIPQDGCLVLTFPCLSIDSVSGPDHFPDITLCPFPSYNHAKLKRYGYYNSFDYAKVCIVIVFITL